MALTAMKMILRIGNKQRVAISEQRRVNRKLLSAIRYPLNAKKGFTLIEVMTAVVILAIGIVGVLQAYAGSIATLEVGQFNINAVNLLKQKMSDIEQIILEQEEPPKSDSGTDGDFLWKWDIMSTGTEGLNALTLSVSHLYNPRTFELNTYVVEKQEEEL